MFAQRGFQIAMRASVVMRDAEKTHQPVFFPAGQGIKVNRSIGEVVHLHQIDFFGPELFHRVAHLRDALILAMRPDLGCDE